MAGLEVLLLGTAALAPAHAVPGADSAAARAAALLVKQAVERIARLREVGGRPAHGGPLGFGSAQPRRAEAIFAAAWCSCATASSRCRSRAGPAAHGGSL